MKRVLSIVLAVIMAFSVATVAFAVDAVEGRVYFGPKEAIKANPGEEVKYEIQFIADPFPETVADVDPNGTYYLMFAMRCDDPDANPFTKVELTEEAKAAGITFTKNPDYYEAFGYELDAVDFIAGDLTIPAKYLLNKESIIVFDAYVKVTESWEVKNYVATTPLGMQVFTGDELGFGSYVLNLGASEGEEIYIAAEGDTEYIYAKPYEPNFFERVWEWIKEKFRRVIALDNVVNSLLETYVFPKADWYDDYMNRKNAEKNAKDAAKEAEKAEAAIS